MAYAIIRTDLMSAIKDASKHVFFKIVTTAVENGNVLKIGSLVTGERNTYTYATPAVTTPLTSIAIVTTPELMSDERKKNQNEFINAVGTVARAFMFEKGDVFSVTAEAVTNAATIAVGDIVELAASTKLKIVASATGLTSGSTKVGTVIGIEGDYFVIRVGD